jgi:hypothetical protein
MTESGVGDMKLLVLSTDQELADAFVQNVCGPVMEDTGCVRCGSVVARIDTLAGDPRLNPDWLKSLAEADMYILLVQHVDILALEELKKVYFTLPSYPSEVPLSIFVVREPGKAEFKMSCQKCGQKLWVRDMHVGKSGTCPSCRKAFMVFSQKVTLRQHLRLPAELPVEQVDGEDHEATLCALGRLFDRTGKNGAEPELDSNALKRSTMRIQIDAVGDL